MGDLLHIGIKFENSLFFHLQSDPRIWSAFEWSAIEWIDAEWSAIEIIQIKMTAFSQFELRVAF